MLAIVSRTLIQPVTAYRTHLNNPYNLITRLHIKAIVQNFCNFFLFYGLKILKKPHNKSNEEKSVFFIILYINIKRAKNRPDFFVYSIKYMP